MDMRIAHHRLDCFDIEQMRECVKGASIYHEQMSAGSFRAQLSLHDCGDFILNTGAYNNVLKASGIFPGDKIILGFLLGKDSEGIINGHSIQYGSLVIAEEGTVLDLPYAKNFHWATIQTDRSLLVIYGLEREKKGFITMSMSDELTAKIGTALELINTSEQCAEGQVVYEDILSLLGKRMDEFEGVDLSVNLSRQIKIVKKAEEYIRHHMHQPLRISEICRMTNTSERVLEYAFNKIYSMSPKRFLTVLRLNEARQLLIKSVPHEVNVTNVAMSCGFRHMGRFSAEYKSLFGELPSKTLVNS